jgi:hypothetical protein
MLTYGGSYSVRDVISRRPVNSRAIFVESRTRCNARLTGRAGIFADTVVNWFIC